MNQITAQDKLNEINKELGYRRSVYSRMVAEGKMAPAAADRRIAVMEAIRDDYNERITEEKDGERGLFR